jgi:hypothetical protein
VDHAAAQPASCSRRRAHPGDLGQHRATAGPSDADGHVTIISTDRRIRQRTRRSGDGPGRAQGNDHHGNPEAQPEPPGAEDIAAIYSGHLAECVTAAIEFWCYRVAGSDADLTGTSYVSGEFLAITS